MLQSANLQLMILVLNRVFQNKAYLVMPAYWAMVPVTDTVNGFGKK